MLRTALLASLLSGAVACGSPTSTALADAAAPTDAAALPDAAMSVCAEFCAQRATCGLPVDVCAMACTIVATPQCLPLLTAYQACVRGRTLDCARGGRAPAECAAVESAFLPCTQGGSSTPPSDAGKDPLPDDAG